MKISELIEWLKHIQKMNGDLDVNVEKVTLAIREWFDTEKRKWDDKLIAYIITDKDE